MNVLTSSWKSLLFSAVLPFAGCGARNPRENASLTMSAGYLNGNGRLDAFGHSNAGFSAAKLREYCKACHAVGSQRFIWTDSDEDLWRYIFSNNAPVRKKLWAEAIYEVLNWPSDVPPDPNPVMDPPSGRDWMPKGAKRLGFAADKVDSVYTRRIILQSLRSEGR